MPHNLGRAPEMIWAKGRNGGQGYWGVYHKGLNGGTNPGNYRMLLNDTHTESDGGGSYTTWYWNDTAPTATHFSLGEISNVNQNNIMYYAMLFASVEGISKCGYYTGTGNAGNAQTTGFLPRFLLIRRVDTQANWYVFDSLRGLHTTSQEELYIDTEDSQNTRNFFTTSSTGFAFVDDNQNASAGKYIYYAHA